MARPRFDRIEADKREAILQAAAGEFAAYGYEAASVNRILDAAGLSKGAFYYYFDDKPDLAATVLSWAMREVFEAFEQMPRAEDAAGFWRGMRAMVDESLASLVRSPLTNDLTFRLGLAMVRDQELARHVMATPEIVRMGALNLAIWKRGQELGAVRRDLPAEVIVGLLQAAKESLIRAFFPKDGVPTDEELERIAELQFDLFRRISAAAEEESP